MRSAGTWVKQKCKGPILEIAALNENSTVLSSAVVEFKELKDDEAGTKLPGTEKYIAL
jgi:hypothetical protein